MKCPECGFVSFPGRDRCKKCGYLFTDVRKKSKGNGSLFWPSRTEAKGPATPASETSLDHTEMSRQEGSELDIELNTGGVSPGSDTSPQAQSTPPESPVAQDWQAELAERVQEYRQRRSRLRNTKEDNPDNLDLDFGSSPPGRPETPPNVIEFPTSEELEHQTRPSTAVRSAPRKEGLQNFDSDLQPEGGEVKPPLSKEMASPSETPPLEIEFGSSQQNSGTGIRAGASSGESGARMSGRFQAGVIDGLVLLSGAAVYSLIFWRIGGRLPLRPLELAVGAVISVFFILLYFAGCTVLTSATPGLMWAGLEVTTFEGNAPAFSDCLWRAFGYLVSISALMLGFVWAVVDPDGLTWHDRMSRTFIVPAHHE